MPAVNFYGVLPVTYFRIFKCIGLFALVCTWSSSFASEGGYSNYVPGFYGDLALAVEPEPGLAFRNDIYFYSAEADRSVRSGLIEADIEIDLSFNYLSVLYKTERKVLGAGYAFGVTFAAGKVDISGETQVGPLRQEFSEDKTSYGDITFVPAIFYWNNGDKFHFTQSFYIVAPVGDYDDSDAANTGLNYWTLKPILQRPT